ncbi:MAG: MarR family winged helix-turn-helix transcriptional regulator [Clostridia bacterium]
MADGETSIDLVLDHLKHLFLAMHERRTADWIDGDLTLAQLRALFVIARHPDGSVGKVGRALGIGLPAASHIVERLVQAGLVERHPHPSDRRVSLVGMAPAGRELLERAETFGPRLVRDWLMDLDHDELAALESGLAAVVRAIERSHGPSERREGASQ